MLSENTTDSITKTISFWLLNLVGACIFIFFYLQASNQQNFEINSNQGNYDQSAYMREAIEWKDSDYQKTLGRNRMPAYLFLISFLHHERMSEHDYFVSVKKFNILLSVALLFILWLLFKNLYGSLISTSFTLIAGFSLFALKSAYVQCEVLHITLFLTLFMTMFYFLEKPRWSLVPIIAGISALSYMTKASMLVMMFFFISFAILNAFLRREQAKIYTVGSFASLFGFLLLISPYIYTSKKEYGAWFYNINTAYCMWSESWNDALDNMPRYNEGLKAGIIPDNIPIGPLSYIEIHGMDHFMNRILTGIGKIYQSFTEHSYGIHKPIFLWIGLSLFIILFFKRKTFFDKKNISQKCFVVITLTIYLLAASFYMQIDNGMRFIAPFYLLILFLCCKTVHDFFKNKEHEKSMKIKVSLSAILVLLICFNIYESYFIVQQTSLQIIGGR